MRVNIEGRSIAKGRHEVQLGAPLALCSMDNKRIFVVYSAVANCVGDG